MKINRKGQVTIPVEIREKCGLLPHTEVAFLVEDGRVVVEARAIRAAQTERFMKHVRSAPRMRMSSKELLALLRDEPDELPPTKQ